MKQQMEKKWKKKTFRIQTENEMNMIIFRISTENDTKMLENEIRKLESEIVVRYKQTMTKKKES